MLLGEASGGYPGPVPPRYADPRRERILILLTDGQTAPEAALAAAERARARGLVVHAIGLGPSVDETLLRALAGDPARYHASPTGEELGAIYREIARGGCP